MLSEALINSSKLLQDLELEDFKKVVNYSHNVLLNRDNQMKLNEFIQIEQEKGDHLTTITLALIRTLSQYRATPKDFDHDINLLLLDQERIGYLKQKVQGNLYELRKVIYHSQDDQTSKIVGMDWRFEVEIASKTKKNTFNPNVQIGLTVKDGTDALEGPENEQNIRTTSFNCDFANLKNLYNGLQEAMKMHNSSKFKMARFSSV